MGRSAQTGAAVDEASRPRTQLLSGIQVDSGRNGQTGMSAEVAPGLLQT